MVVGCFGASADCGGRVCQTNVPLRCITRRRRTKILHLAFFFVAHGKMKMTGHCQMRVTNRFALQHAWIDDGFRSEGISSSLLFLLFFWLMS
jgi:hypothetical protein